MFNIFRRINTGGLTLNGQEIRHALHKGPVRGFLKTLAASDEFQRATDYSVKTERMADRECVLRFMAFHIDPWEEYASNDLDGYLGTAMEKINRMKAVLYDDASTDELSFELIDDRIKGRWECDFKYSRTSDKLIAMTAPTKRARLLVGRQWEKVPPFGGRTIYITAERIGPRKHHDFR